MRKTFASILIVVCIICLAACGKKKDKKSDATAEKLLPEGYEAFCKDSFENNICGALDGYAWAKDKNVVLIENSQCTSKREIWDSFFKVTEAKNPASVFCAFYYSLSEESTSEDSNYPKLYFYYLTYDGNKYTIKTRACDTSTPDSDKQYSYLKHYKGDMPKTAKYDHYEYYVLVNDPSVTWEDIQKGMFSSQSGDYIDNYVVFSNYYD